MTLRKFIFLLLGFILIHPLRAQDKTARMERDIDVFEKVLNELFRNSGNLFSSHNSAQASGTYVPGYGVIVNVPAAPTASNNFNWMHDLDQDIHVILKESRKNMKGAAEAMKHSQRSMEQAERDLKKTEKEIEIRGAEKAGKKHQGKKEVKEEKTIILRNGEQVIISDAPMAPIPPMPPQPCMPALDPHTAFPEANAYTYAYSYNADAEYSNDSTPFKRQEMVRDLMKKALQNYGDLLTQLAPNEKIMLVYDESGSGNVTQTVYVNNGKQKIATHGRAKISAEVKREDIDALRSGKINEKEFNSRITLNTQDAKDEHALDYKIFAGILETVFNNAEQSSFRIKGDVRHTSLNGFGVIYNARMRNMYHTPDSDEEEKNPKMQEEQNRKIKEEFDQLEKTLKNTMLDYGRSLRSLKDDQFILLNIQVTGQGTPKTLRVKVKKDVLTQYEKEQITREKALADIVVTRDL